MPKKLRGTDIYDLKRGHKIVDRGTTNDPERREEQHLDDGKRFTHFKITSRRMTEKGAQRKESEDLARYREGHKGRNPMYIKDGDG